MPYPEHIDTQNNCSAFTRLPSQALTGLASWGYDLIDDCTINVANVGALTGPDSYRSRRSALKVYPVRGEKDLGSIIKAEAHVVHGRTN